MRKGAQGEQIKRKRELICSRRSLCSWGFSHHRGKIFIGREGTHTFKQAIFQMHQKCSASIMPEEPTEGNRKEKKSYQPKCPCISKPEEWFSIPLSVRDQEGERLRDGYDPRGQLLAQLRRRREKKKEKLWCRIFAIFWAVPRHEHYTMQKRFLRGFHDDHRGSLPSEPPRGINVTSTPFHSASFHFQPESSRMTRQWRYIWYWCRKGDGNQET